MLDVRCIAPEDSIQLSICLLLAEPELSSAKDGLARAVLSGALTIHSAVQRVRYCYAYAESNLLLGLSGARIMLP